MGTVGLHGINDEYLMRSLYVSTQCCLALNDKERAKTYIGQVDISSLAAAYPDLPFLADEFGYMRASGDFARMGALCTQIMAVNGESVRLRFFQLVEKEFPVFDSQKLEAARALAAVKGEHKFLTLHRMRAALADGDSSQAAALAQALLVKQDAGADPYFADVLYCVMLCGQPLAPALDVFGAALEETLNVLAILTRRSARRSDGSRSRKAARPGNCSAARALCFWRSCAVQARSRRAGISSPIFIRARSFPFVNRFTTLPRSRNRSGLSCRRSIALPLGCVR